MNIIPIAFSFLAFVFTLLGGLFALKNKNKMHFIMAFAAGVLLGVVSFDILPEIIEQIKLYDFNPTGPMIALVCGFLLFHFLEKSILLHSHQEENYAKHKHPHIGIASALALAGHSFMDGVGIGLGFKINTAVGILVAVAVLSHDFTDGMNTATLLLSNNNTDRQTKFFLMLDAIAPILGSLFAVLLIVPPYFLILYLGFFAGFLLYIGASDILPEAHAVKSSYALMLLTALGTFLIFGITSLI